LSGAGTAFGGYLQGGNAAAAVPPVP